ncbi:MAG: lipid-binding SYLF domain-containing protein [Blastocatellia bacterium]
MKLAPAICLLVLSGSLLPQTASAQHRLPNGQPVRRAVQQAPAPASAVPSQRTGGAPPAQAPAPPAPVTSTFTTTTTAPAGAVPTVTAKMESPQVIRIELTLPAGTVATGGAAVAPVQQVEKKPPPCTGLENGHDWLARTDRAATVLRELLDATDRNMSQGVLNRSDCVAVIPSLKKGGLTFGGHWGRGVMSCRYDNKSWSPPVFFTVTGGSFGLQIGLQVTDLVMMISNRSGADALLGNKLELGASAGATALMMGRHAGISSDMLMNSRVVSYARSRGLFAGVELKGAYFRPDNMAHHVIYGDDAHVHDILSSERIPQEARATCYNNISVFPRTLRDISPVHLYYARVQRPRYPQATSSAPAAR